MKYYFQVVLKLGSPVAVPIIGQTIEVATLTNPLGERKELKGVITLNPEFLGAAPIDSVYMVENLVSTSVDKYRILKDTPVVAIDSKMDPEGRLAQLGVKAATPEEIQEYLEFVSSHGGKVKGSILHKLRMDYPLPSSETFTIKQNKWDLLIHNAQFQTNTLLTGPTGTGKTEIVNHLSKAIKKKVVIFDMGTMLDPISGLIGTHRLEVREGVSASVFDMARFALSIQEPVIILLDELSRAPAMSNNILLPCLDSRRSLYADMAASEDQRIIKVHEDCQFIATANIGGEYSGTSSIDRAVWDRFFPIELSYLSEEEETNLLLERNPTLQRKEAEIICTMASRIRNMYLKGELSAAVSTRYTLSAGYLTSHGFSVIEAIRSVFLPLFEGTEFEGERAAVVSLLTIS